MQIDIKVAISAKNVLNLENVFYIYAIFKWSICSLCKSIKYYTEFV